MYRLSCRCDGRFEGNEFGRSEDRINRHDRPIEGPASALTVTQARLFQVTVAGSPRTGQMRRMGPNLTLRPTSENAQQLLASDALHSGNAF
jgi:hypothetical protein